MKLTGSEIVKAIASADDVTALMLAREIIADRLRTITKMATDQALTYGPKASKIRESLPVLDAAVELIVKGQKGALPTPVTDWDYQVYLSKALNHEYALETRSAS